MKFYAGFCLIAGVGVSVSLAAPVLPDAGQTLREVAPGHRLLPEYSGSVPLPAVGNSETSIPKSGGAKIKVKRFVIDGASRFPVPLLEALVKDCYGQKLDLAELYARVQRVTQYYRQHGYLLAHAYLPAQDVQQGVIRMVVLEGRYERVQLLNHSRVKSAVLNPLLRPLAKNTVIDGAVLERQLLLLDDIPGVVIHSVLSPGTQTGFSNLNIDATTGAQVQAQIGSDNWGERFTGAIRGHAQVDVLDPLGIGDHLNAYLMDSQYGATKYGRAAYDAEVGGSGMRLGTSYEDMDYTLEQNYGVLDAFGTARTASLYGSWPWVRSRANDMNVQWNYAHRVLHDFVDAVGSSDKKWFQVGTLSLNGDNRLNNGASAQWSMGVTHGVLQLDALTQAHDQQAYHTAGTYDRMNMQGSLLWPVRNNWSLYGHLEGQRADKNLDLAEKMSLGGPSSVRAYPVGEVQADDAIMGTTELRFQCTEALQIWMFWDAAYGHTNHQSLPTDTANRRSISGPGIGGGLNIGRGLSMRTDWAWPTGSPAVSAPTERPTIWWQISQSF